MKLTQEEINSRMQEWRNIKVLHAKTLKVNKKLRADNKALKKRVVELEKENAELKGEIQDLKVMVAELQEMVFGKRRKKKNDEDNDDSNDANSNINKNKKLRSPSSYKREIPKEKEITERKNHEISHCPDCNTKLTRKKIIIFYEEDIPLPTEDKSLKEVIEHNTEKGYCQKCKKWHSAISIPPSKVIIGGNVKLYICYLSILIRLSYSQIRHLLLNTYKFKISDGEIINILSTMEIKWRSEYERIKKRIISKQELGVHMDETSWGKSWLWVMASINTEDVIYHIGQSRGKGNAENLLGENFESVRVSDGYGVYKNLKGECALCWAHPHRYLKNLKNTKTLTKTTKDHCKKAYEEFSEIYETIRNYTEESFEKEKRIRQKEELRNRIRNFCKPNEKDPKKLRNIKKQFTKREDEYLTCMNYDGVPCDNNKAERKLRHFVIKRKISFGSQSERGINAFNVCASVLMTYWKKFENNFFPALMKIS